MRNKLINKLLLLLVVLFVLGNIAVYNHAYRFTHFVDPNESKTKEPEALGFFEKARVAFTGITVPKPFNDQRPTSPFTTHHIQSDELLEAWHIEVAESKGLVLMFHGYAGSKSRLLPYSGEFNKLGYSTLLVDFRGSGGSSGNETTIGFKEAKDVTKALDYCQAHIHEENLILFGPSMGAVSILKAIDEYKIKPNKIIIECPFGSMLTTTKTRFKAMGVPAFPFAELLLAYGGLQTGFNAFKHEPTEYAKGVNIPTLLLYGAKDARVTRQETDDIFSNLRGEKELVIFERSEHEIYLNDEAEKWIEVVGKFLDKKLSNES